MRIIDVMIAGAGLVLLSPVLLLLAIAIKLDSQGPVFYCAERIGYQGARFRLYKFRSMVHDADRRGPGITVASDQRVTAVGRFLRRTKLDELPQLFNVLKGEMSLVGPRPEDPRYVALYTPEQRQILTVRPGITSAASLTYRREENLLSGADWESVYRQEVMPTKIAIDLEYMTTRTIWTDFTLIGQTIAAMFR
jgi:lipopolysaccharide/colanic/teichoic acid biosynthesis glycosyltransferase